MERNILMLQKNSMKALNSSQENICRKFQIPAEGKELLDFFFTNEELEFLASEEREIFSAEDYGQDFIKKEYGRGIISKTDESGKNYRISSFYSMLDVFVVTQKEKYDTLSKAQKKALDDWYFDAYYSGLDENRSVRPTEDKVLPLEEVIKFIDEQERPVYLNYCDCRSLTGDCGLPTKTCITYRNGINTFADRGISEHIDKERAKEIVVGADKAGLMHTVNSNGICNCCGDCCYLFRSQKKRESVGFWPESAFVVDINSDECIKCGLCLKRCHFGVFQKEEKITLDISKCVGCGICVNTCPKKALYLREREKI